jgi:hypothetical protein
MPVTWELYICSLAALPCAFLHREKTLLRRGQIVFKWCKKTIVILYLSQNRLINSSDVHIRRRAKSQSLEDRTLAVVQNVQKHRVYFVLEYFKAGEFLMNIRVNMIQLLGNSALMPTASGAKSFYGRGMLNKVPFVLADSESLPENLLTGTDLHRPLIVRSSFINRDSKQSYSHITKLWITPGKSFNRKQIHINSR